MKTKLNKGNGISLIVLVITIIIMIILAGAIILTLSESGIILNTNKSVFQSDLKTMQQELSVYISNMQLQDRNKYEKEELYADKEMLQENGSIVEGKTIQDILETIDDKYIDEIKVVNGKLTYVGNDFNKLKWANEILLSVRGYDVEQKESVQNYITLENSANLNLINYRIYGNSVQNGTPSTDTPIEIESVGFLAENLFDPNAPHEKGYLEKSDGSIGSTNNEDQYVYTFPVKPNREYTYDGSLYRRNSYCLYDSDMNYLNVSGGFINTDSPITFKTTSDTAYVRICTKKSKVDDGSIRFNEGSTIISTEKYDKYVIQTEVRKNNLFDINSYRLAEGFGQESMRESFENDVWIGKGLEGNSECAASAGTLQVYLNDSLEANKDYTISFYATLLEVGIYSSKLSIYFGNENYYATMLRSFTDNPLGDRKKFTCTINMSKPLEIVTFRLNNNKWKFEFDTLKIEEGTEATDGLEGIIKQNIYLDEPLRKVGEYADYIDFRTQEVVRNVEVIDDTGTLSLEESLKGLDTPIREKISLPAILLNEGKNIIEVTTAIAPSKIDTIYYTK